MDGQRPICNDRERPHWDRRLRFGTVSSHGPARLLVIGSQCDILNELKFLPEVAERLHALLIHPGPGECVGVPLNGRPPGLLLDPTVVEARAAMEGAFLDAARDGATLILAYIGHGEFPHERSGSFFLMPTDAEPTPRKAIDFAPLVEGCIHESNVEFGIFVLLDACQAGAGAWHAMERWARSMEGNFSFVLLTPTDDRVTANAPLTRAVIELLERGAPEAEGRRLYGRDVHQLLKDGHRPAQYVECNAEAARLYLARNLARPRRRLLEGQRGTRPDLAAHLVFPAHAPVG